VPSIPNRLPHSKREQLKQSAERLHALGPLSLGYFLIEIAEGRNVEDALRRYLVLTPDLVQGVGADRADAEATARAAALAYVPPRGRG
jgi:hypothetical protein